MIKQILVMVTVLLLGACSSKDVTTNPNKPVVADIVPVYGEYKPVKYSQTVIQETIDTDNNVVRTPTHVMSGATYWKNGYYVVPNIFSGEATACENCLVTFVKSEDIDGSQGVVDSKISWRERTDGEYTFSGWIGRNGFTYYSYIYDLSSPVKGAKFVQNFNTVIEPMTRTLYVGTVANSVLMPDSTLFNNNSKIVAVASLTGIIPGSPLFSTDNKIIGMTLSLENVTIEPNHTLYIDKNEIEKDWKTFKANKKIITNKAILFD